MKILTKDEVKNILAIKSGFFSVAPRAVNCVKYISGIDEVDEKYRTKKDVIALIIESYDLGYRFQFLHGFSTDYVALLHDNIKSIALEDREQIIEQKDKSIVARAIVGGVLLGPVGAVVGGMTGFGTKEHKAKMPDVIITITYQEKEQEEKLIFLSCKYKDKDLVEDFFRYAYAMKVTLNKPIEITEQPTKSETISLADEIQKLVNLKEKGLITEDEFVKMKQKLIS